MKTLRVTLPKGFKFRTVDLRKVSA